MKVLVEYHSGREERINCDDWIHHPGGFVDFIRNGSYFLGINKSMIKNIWELKFSSNDKEES